MLELPSHFGSDLIVVGAFGLLGIVVFCLAFKFWDWMTPGLDEQEELKKGNIAVAVVISAFLISVAIIMASVIQGVLRG